MDQADVWRGCLSAYITTSAIGSIGAYALLLSAGEGGLIGVPVLIVFVGAFVAIPFVGLAFGIHSILARRKARIAWWAAPGVVFTLGSTITLAFANATDLAWLLVHCAWISAGLGVSFWLAAVGRRWSAIPTMDRVTPAPDRPYAVREHK